MNLHVREASPDNVKTVADFNSRMLAETEDRPLDATLIDPGVAAILLDSGKGRYWAAEVDGKIVGQIMVICERSDWRNGRLWWIQSVYVREDYRRKGVFSTLHRHVESLARQDSDICGLRPYVEEGNTRA